MSCGVPPQIVIDSGLETLVSIDTLALRQGLECSTTDLLITSQEAGDYATPLRLDPSAPVTVVARTKLAQGRPLAYMVDVLPQAIVTPEAIRQGFAGSVLDFLVARRDPAPTHAVANIVPLKADRELAQRLGVGRATVLLLLEETIYSREGAPIDFSRNYFVPQFFQFHLIRRIPV